MDLNSLKRNDLIKELENSGIKDKNVLKAIANVRREEFVLTEFRRLAYDNTSLPISSNQTISQPYTVAFMTELLEIKPGEKILEIGTGSGYQSAVLRELSAEVYSVERIFDLYRSASDKLSKLGYTVHLKNDDGTKGWKEFAPFDKIIVTAGSPKIPKQLLEQLAVNGLMIIPVGDENSQDLYLIRKTYEETQNENPEENLLSETAGDDADNRKVKYMMKRYKNFKFVPLIGEEAWAINN
ncbi:MAG: protein-L-isoaspartate(D-aspartate) O-methyltransferase [Ignavibacteria bacterium]